MGLLEGEVALLKDNCEVGVVRLIEWKRVIREDMCNSCIFCKLVGSQVLSHALLPYLCKIALKG